MNARSPTLKYVLFIAFSLSGFSGLIYESVWTNYLKFFLGHAAYAQSLVLAMFMGGMAGGAWLSGRYIKRIRNPLLAYAAIELVIGLFGVTFHQVFVAASNFMFDGLLPGIDSSAAVEGVRWGLAAILILPQTVLLGATFPLMSIGLLRAFPSTPGSSMSMLYFTNSIGAVAGVLLSGFVLIGLVGLPGTVLAAGMINILLALVVYMASKNVPMSVPVDAPPDNAAPPPMLRPMLLVALVTGLSSFIYEISWIRMLVMITGASTHAFELMLAAFILGLALGGFWLRTRIDQYRRPLVALGVIQLLMGGLALCTVLGYNGSMSLMLQLFKALQHNEDGYTLFNLSSQFIAIALMLPTTFMAGMTLPLISLVLFKHGGGEAAIGKVYAFNTLGAIVGIAFAAMLLLPVVGLKNAVVVGAALDLALVLFLFWRAGVAQRWQAGAWAMALCAVAAVCVAPPFNVERMASSIFRAELASNADNIKVLMHRDGRTATVDVFTARDHSLTIATNGKPDASIHAPGGKTVSLDEPTMTLFGALPQLLNPKAETAAVIGMGSGLSANVLLMNDKLKEVDIVEIEEAMVDGARLFGPASARVFQDPRSRIHIDDAKSYFASHKKRYDIIVSVPSDTWVSGVSTLFTNEFYKRMRRHLTADGLLLQWIATYGSSPEMLASIMQAIGDNFSDYRLYATTDNVLVLVAKLEGKVPELHAAGFSNPALKQALERIGLSTVNDLHAHELGRKAFFDPLFRSNGAPVNSDYFPFVDQAAAKQRFLMASYQDATTLNVAGVPIPGINFNGDLPVSSNIRSSTYKGRSLAQLGRQSAAYLGSNGSTNLPLTQPPSHVPLTVLRNKPGCNDAIAQLGWQVELLKVARVAIPATTTEEAAPMLAFLRGQLCDSSEARSNRDLLALISALSARDMPATERAAEKFFATDQAVELNVASYAFNALLLSYYQQQKWTEARALIKHLPEARNFFSDVVKAHADVALQRRRMASLAQPLR